MQIKITEEEMQDKINSIEARLQMLEKALEEEMGKSFFNRNPSIVNFIYIERKIHIRLLKELKCIFNA